MSLTLDLNAIVRRHSKSPLLRGSSLSQQSRAEKSHANHCVRAVFLGLLSCGFKMKLRNRQFLKFIDNLFVRSLCAARDPVSRTAHLTYLKSSCHAARKFGLAHTSASRVKSIRNVTGVLVPRGYMLTPTQCYQLSCIARSLPAGGDKEVTEALAKFEETCLSPETSLDAVPLTSLVIQDNLLNSKQSLKRLSKCKKRARKIPSARLSPVGESSCAMYTAKEGGRTRHFKEVTDTDYRTFEVGPTFEVSLLLSRFSTEKARHERRVQKYVRTQSERPRQPSRTVAVRELGNKVRIVTINDPYLVTIAHSVRKVLYPLVTGWRGNREALGELPNQLRLNRKSKPKGRIVISGDLSRATDTLSHVWLTKLCLALEIDPTLIHLGMKVGDLPVTRGAFMGLPASWTLLELTHYLICINIDPLGNFFLKGDDIIAWWTSAQWQLYKALCVAVGFEINISKSYISRSRGTFCEGLYELSQDAQGPLLKIIPTLPLRGFVKRTGGPFFTDLATTMNSAVRRGYPRLRLWKVVANSFSKEIEIATKFRVNLYTPECLGGLGLPHPCPEELSGQYISSLVWGGLDKDLPAPATKAVSARSECNRILNKQLRGVKYRSGLQEEATCPHFEEWSGFYRMRASVLDCDGKTKQTEIGLRKYLGMLRKAEKIVPRAPIRAQDRLKWGTIPTLFKELKPTRASILTVYRHPCDKADDSRLCEAATPRT